ncbi:MAG: vancomycin resistance protein, partial [Clostridiales bacterium]|nr:vancomycin resistance protein [Clostridiales bacterium]
ISKYSDIKNAYGLDDEAILQHFVKYGMKEGRQAISTFNVYSYAYKYADLRSAYKNDLSSYYTHYMKYGKKEGRTATGTTTMQNCVTTYNGVDYSSVYSGTY